MDYMVIWDGRHHDRDQDLLCAQPIPLKRSGRKVFVPLARGDVIRAVEEAFVESETGRLSVHEVMAVIGLDYDRTRRAVDRLQARGRVIPEPTGHGNERIYRLVRGKPAC